MLPREQIRHKLKKILLLSLTVIIFLTQSIPVWAIDRELNDDQRNLIALAIEDHGEAVRYYCENMIYDGIYGTYILGKENENELELLSRKTLISFEKTESKKVEDQTFRLYVYTDRSHIYVIQIPTKTRSVYTFKELLKTIPENEKIVFAVFHFQSYEYENEKVSFRFKEYTDSFVTVNGKEYCIKSDGTVLTKSAVVDGIRYKFDESGVCQGKYTGFTKSDKGRRYWKNGKLIKNGWIRVKGKRKYYAGADGYFVKEMPETEDFPKISVEFPDGAVYESSNGGASWTKDGEETQRPLVYAAFEGECPLCRSGDAYLTIYNGSVPSLIEKGVWFLREENGEWIEAEYLEEVEVLAASAYVIGKNAEGRFKIPTELYVPFEGKCRYIHEMHDFDNEIYTVSAEFSVVGESTESVSP